MFVVTENESENFPAFILPPRKESCRAPKHQPPSAVVGPALAGGEPGRAAVQIGLQVRPVPLPLLQVLGGKGEEVDLGDSVRPREAEACARPSVETSVKARVIGGPWEDDCLKPVGLAQETAQRSLSPETYVVRKWSLG